MGKRPAPSTDNGDQNGEGTAVRLPVAAVDDRQTQRHQRNRSDTSLRDWQGFISGSCAMKIRIASAVQEACQ